MYSIFVDNTKSVQKDMVHGRVNFFVLKENEIYLSTGGVAEI